MSRLYPLIKITFLDGIRNKIALGVIVFAIISSLANIVITDLAAQDVGKVAIDMALSSFSITGFFLVLFVCGNSLYRDIDKKTVSIVLSRAISRRAYIVSRLLGYSLLILFVSIISSIIGIVSLYLIKIIHIKNFTTPFGGVFVAYFFSFLSFIVLLTLLIFFSSFSTSSYTAILLTVMIYLIGNSVGELRDFAESKQAIAAGFSLSFRYILRVVHFLLPDFAKFDLKVFAANGLPIDKNFIIFAILYAVIYCTILIVLSIKAFEKREFI